MVPKDIPGACWTAISELGKTAALTIEACNWGGKKNCSFTVPSAPTSIKMPSPGSQRCTTSPCPAIYNQKDCRNLCPIVTTGPTHMPGDIEAAEKSIPGTRYTVSRDNVRWEMSIQPTCQPPRNRKQSIKNCAIGEAPKIVHLRMSPSAPEMLLQNVPVQRDGRTSQKKIGRNLCNNTSDCNYWGWYPPTLKPGDIEAAEKSRYPSDTIYGQPGQCSDGKCQYNRPANRRGNRNAEYKKLCNWGGRPKLFIVTMMIPKCPRDAPPKSSRTESVPSCDK